MGTSLSEKSPSTLISSLWRRQSSGDTKEKALQIKDLQGLPIGAAGRNRTHDPLVRSQVLYPAELQPLSFEL